MEKIGSKHFEHLVSRIERTVATNRTGPRYSVVLWDARAKLGLSSNEYLLADVIHKLSGVHSKISGWCYASKPYLGDLLGVSERAVFSLVKKLKEKGIVECHPEKTHLLRTTHVWHETVEILREKQRQAH